MIVLINLKTIGQENETDLDECNYARIKLYKILK